MKKIAMLVSEIKEKLEGVEHYAKQALKNKEDDRDLASTYDKLSEIRSRMPTCATIMLQESSAITVQQVINRLLE